LEEEKRTGSWEEEPGIMGVLGTGLNIDAPGDPGQFLVSHAFFIERLLEDGSRVTIAAETCMRRAEP